MRGHQISEERYVNTELGQRIKLNSGTGVRMRVQDEDPFFNILMLQYLWNGKGETGTLVNLTRDRDAALESLRNQAMDQM